MHAVIPAKAGIQNSACTEHIVKCERAVPDRVPCLDHLDSGFRRNDAWLPTGWGW